MDSVWTGRAANLEDVHYYGVVLCCVVAANTLPLAIADRDKPVMQGLLLRIKQPRGLSAVWAVAISFAPLQPWLIPCCLDVSMLRCSRRRHASTAD